MNFIELLGYSSYIEEYLDICSKTSTDTYIEKHHILPTSIFEGRQKDENNIVSLSLQDHYRVHELLFLHYKEIKLGSDEYMKMSMAYTFMSERSKLNTPILYEQAKIASIEYNKNKTIVKGNNGNIKISIDEYKTGKYTSVSCGKTSVKDIQGNCFSVSVDDPRIESGELVGVVSGKITTRNIEGNVKHLSVEDERYTSGEYFPVSCIYFYDIYDNNDNIVHTFTSIIRDCGNNNIPYKAFEISIKNGGTPIFTSKYPPTIGKLRRNGNIKFVGWYAKKRKMKPLLDNLGSRVE
jgi:hypothetical protein